MVPDKPFGSARDAGEALARHGVPAQQGTLLGCSLAGRGQGDENVEMYFSFEVFQLFFPNFTNLEKGRSWLYCSCQGGQGKG